MALVNDTTTTLEYNDPSALDKISESADHISKIRNWFDMCKKAREQKTDRWRKNENLYFGNHWGNSAPGTRWQTRMVYNFPFSAIETILPIIGDFMPVVDIMPKQYNDMYFADMMHKRVQQIAQNSNLYEKILLAVKDSLLYGNGFIEVLPEFKDDRFVGFDISVVDPFVVMPERYATDINLDDGEYFLYAVPMRVSEIKRQFDVDVKPEGNLDDYRAFQIEDGDDYYNDQSGVDMALVIECYSNDDPENYPNGRHTIIAGETLLVDEPLELYRMPVFMVSNYKSPHQFWGKGEPENVRTIVKTINETMSAIADNIRQTGFPARKITSRAKAKAVRPYTGRPGEEIIVDDPSDVSYEQPPSIPGYIQNFISQNSMFMDSITGIQDVTQGRQPTGVKSGRAIMALQEASQTRIRFKINSEIKRFVREIGEYMVNLIQIYDTEISQIREKNIEGQYEFVEYNPQGVFDANGNPEGSPEFDPLSAKTLQDSEFDIEVASGSRYPGGRLAKEERALELFQAGIYGIEDVVKALDEPDKQSIIERYYERMSAMQGGEEQAQANPVSEELGALVQQANQTGIGSEEEAMLFQLIMQQPELLQDPVLQELDPAIMERITQVMNNQTTS